MNLNVEPPRHASHLFTIRLWRETLDATRSEWRGRVVHARSGETRYFRDWTALLAFVRACLQETDDPVPDDVTGAEYDKDEESATRREVKAARTGTRGEASPAASSDAEQCVHEMTTNHGLEPRHQPRKGSRR